MAGSIIYIYIYRRRSAEAFVSRFVLQISLTIYYKSMHIHAHMRFTIVIQTSSRTINNNAYKRSHFSFTHTELYFLSSQSVSEIVLSHDCLTNPSCSNTNALFNLIKSLLKKFAWCNMPANERKKKTCTTHTHTNFLRQKLHFFCSYEVQFINSDEKFSIFKKK